MAKMQTKVTGGMEKKMAWGRFTLGSTSNIVQKVPPSVSERAL